MKLEKCRRCKYYTKTTKNKEICTFWGRPLYEDTPQIYSSCNAFLDKNIPDVPDEKEVENKYICKECADDACHLIVIGNTYPPEQCPFWKEYKANWEQDEREKE